MRLYLVVFVALFPFILLANEDELRNEVWVDGSTFYKSINHRKKSTIYFKQWSDYIPQFLEDENYYTAMQLDRSFTPLPSFRHHIPNLSGLAALRSDSILNDYLSFLERLGRTRGFNYLVLPDTTGLSSLEKSVLQKANQKSPYFFLKKSFINYSVPSTKREFAAEVQEAPVIWVARQGQNLSKIGKWASKYLTPQEFEFFDKLRMARENAFIPVHALPEHLKMTIFEQGVIAIDEQHQLPVEGKEITYLGDNPMLKYWLKKHRKVLDHRKKGAIAIVDANYSEIPQENDIVISYAPRSYSPQITQIILPFDMEGFELTFCKMLFGSKGIYGNSEEGRLVRNHQYLGISDPFGEGMERSFISKIDSLGALAISKYATPGIQLAVARNGHLVFDDTYGYYTYDSLKAVTDTTLYDVASLTKVLATLPAVALLVDQGKLALDDSISNYLKDFTGSNKSGITIRQLLAHNSGLRSYIPFWRMMMDGDRLDAFYYKSAEDEALDIRTYGLEPHPILQDTLRNFIIDSDLIKDPTKYNYSDLGFMILHLVVEKASGKPFDQFLNDEFYRPLEMRRTVFNPLKKGFLLEEIAPTEYDHRYRNDQVWGEVHDRNASVFGGVAGHAGLFSTAADISKMMQMLLNGGYYGGKRYLSHEVLESFNMRYFENNRRGLAWDKKAKNGGLAADKASDRSFGHSGFTGSFVWADPETNVVFVFLSNRIYPNSDNWKLSELNTRTNMHNAIYESLYIAE